MQRGKNVVKSFGGRGSAPDPAGGAYSAPQIPSALGPNSRLVFCLSPVNKSYKRPWIQACLDQPLLINSFIKLCELHSLPHVSLGLHHNGIFF